MGKVGVDVEPGGAGGGPGQLRVPQMCLHLKLDPKGSLQGLFLRVCGYVVVELAVIQTGEHISRVPRSYINYMVVFRRV